MADTATRDQPVLSWLATLLPAAVTGYAMGPLISSVLLLFEGAESMSRINTLPLILGGQVVMAVIAAVMLRRIDGVWRRVGIGLQRAGWLLLATIPVLILLTVMIVRSDSSIDQGGSTAAFFMLILFGGYYALQGMVLLGIGARAKRRARQSQS